MIDVSVIIPIYKAEAYLRPCLDSLLAQTHANFEAILVDDGSPDKSGAICDEYAARDARIRVIHKKNAGEGMARNSGLDVARGEYVYFCDSDDLMDEHLLEDNLRVARKEGADIIAFGFRESREDSEKTILPELSGSLSYDEFWDRFPEAEYVTCVWVHMYRRAYLEKYRLRFNTLTTGADAYFTYDTFAAPFERIAFNRRAYYIYRILPQSAIRGYKPARLENEIIVAEHYGQVLNSVPQARGRYQAILDKRYFLSCLSIFQNMAWAREMPYKKRREIAVDYIRRPAIAEAVRRARIPAEENLHRKLLLCLLKLHMYDLVLMLYSLR